MLKSNNIKSILSSAGFEHFFHFFTVFSGIFIIMTTLILQVMRTGLYASPDSSLTAIAKNANQYVALAVARTITVTETDSSDDNDTTYEPKISITKATSNIDIILFDEKGNRLTENTNFSKLQNLDVDVRKRGTIISATVPSLFTKENEHYHYITVKVHDTNYPNVKYMTIAVNVEQLVAAKERYERIIITLMVIFWIVSIGASIYLAMWTRKPIIESYEKQKSFVENASHELRTPLSVLQNRLEVLLRKPNETILDNFENLASSLEEVRNMRLLTTNLLNLARRDDGIKADLTLITPEEIETIFENYSLIAEEGGKQFNPKNLVVRSFKSDRTLLKQVMTILFDNAMKYTGDDGVIDFTVKTTERTLLLSIADNGFGISDTDKKKIFDRFYRVSKARTRQQGGFGLGLSLAQQIVKSLKGSIMVKDNTPQGTIFEVKIPINK
ncbi:sensor histidine kinase [Streptococcus sciuri]|uniref:histidine kinase n=1 Tax=Streptococcus sciuri TaxID=2973939 RepID=A0ABT2F754_9STRE|nr:HAMP domain-containing sensor histidine kinase [Streptococcus sciuri]MCS4487647.1 HAMP domain-containing histidine kinase [Streptococcus sciuri]